MRTEFVPKEQYGIEDLLEIMDLLRSENGCPWDREQTHASIRKNFIEETYEAVEAIDREDPVLLQEELGDVLLQVVFHAQMEKEQGSFSFNDICDGICKKLITRHPHIFGEESLSDANAVHSRWEEIKRESKGQKTASETLEAVPKQFPALMRATKVQQRAENALDRFETTEKVLAEVKEEETDLSREVFEGDRNSCAEKLGDLLFATVALARKLELDPEECLTVSTEKFIRRFRTGEEMALALGKNLSQCSDEDLLSIWQEAKKKHC